MRALVTAKDGLDAGATVVSWPVGAGLAGVGLLIATVGAFFQRRSPVSLVACTVVAMLWFQGVYTWAENSGPDPMRMVASAINRDFRGARIYCVRLPTPPRRLGIYLEGRIQCVSDVSVIPDVAETRLLLVSESVTAPAMPEGSFRRMVFQDRHSAWEVWQLP
jgi:hypothetical protein